MVKSRRITARRANPEAGEEPVLEAARRKVALQGGSLRAAIREIREQRRERAREEALAEAPTAEQREDGTYVRISSNPRWPFGVKGEEVIAPFGLSECGLPRTQDPAISKAGPRKNSLAAKGEARDIIMNKLERLGCDPIMIMAEIAMDAEEKSEVRLRAAAELATMVYPRLRGVESTQRTEKTVFVVAVPSEQPATVDAWLSSAEGPRRIAAAVEDATNNIIDVESSVVE